MNVRVLLLALALMVAPVGAQSDACDERDSEDCKPNSGSNTSSSDKPDQESESDRDEETEPGSSANKPGDNSGDGSSDDTDSDDSDSDDSDDDQEARGRDKRALSGDYVQFELNGGLHNYTIRGHPIIADWVFTVEKRENNALRTSDGWVQINDNPTGLIGYKGEGTQLTLAAGAVATPSGEGWILQWDGYSAKLAGNVTLEGDVLTAHGFFRIHMPPAGELKQYKAAIEEAVEKRHFGAEVDRDGRVQSYDDMDVNVTRPEKISRDQPLVVRVSAELDEGRTVIIDVDPKNLTGPDLELRYFDVLGDVRREVIFTMADSLADIMDPTDDSGPEYWVVEDADGIHVMASIDTWSTHEISIASVGEFVTQPSVIMGAVAGILGVAAAGVIMLRQRKL